jgi:hypothetical protein
MSLRIDALMRMIAAIALAGLVGAAAVVPLGESPRAEEKSMTTTPEKSTAKARASASASASSSAKSGGKDGSCEARTTASAEAQSGDKRESDYDEDFVRKEGAGCSANATSRASATSGGRKSD